MSFHQILRLVFFVSLFALEVFAQSKPAPVEVPCDPFEEVSAMTKAAGEKLIIKIKSAADFQKQVKESKLPTMLYFTAEWCGHCTAFQNTGKYHYAAVNSGGRVNFASIDIDTVPDVHARLGKPPTPTVMAFRDGKPLEFFGSYPATPETPGSMVMEANEGLNLKQATVQAEVDMPYVETINSVARYLKDKGADDVVLSITTYTTDENKNIIYPSSYSKIQSNFYNFISNRTAKKKKLPHVISLRVHEDKAAKVKELLGFEMEKNSTKIIQFSAGKPVKTLPSDSSPEQLDKLIP